MRKFLSLSLALICMTLPTSSFAHKGEHGEGQRNSHGRQDAGGDNHEHHDNRGKPTQVYFKLKPSNIAFTDLASAGGRIEFKSKNGRARLKARVMIPFPAPSLGISDLNSAGAAQIHVEFSRADAVIADCTLGFRAEMEDDDMQSSAQYAAFLQDASAKGLKELFGSCGGAMPSLMKGDSAKAYAVVNTARVDFLATPAVVTPTPTPTPTPAAP